jgi:lipopolysaccharide/colanic/teichoic acid biosynthesis glycosyltransferase
MNCRNVLVRNMGLIGPRPLLPHDTVRQWAALNSSPGITGWAQINGGNLISKEEKGALDDWYIRNASLWLSLARGGATLIWRCFLSCPHAIRLVEESLLDLG